ncbi:hypothetical protein M408DRAFT_19156 [Serendipita vermifera MAFF 305830]|uniref:DNA repair protein SWI5 homolog n=1 Tax=Serendipita vermifera MAFF 305830 TaxID=933852 RepID=A0A0C3BS55_SERVB|nr:hypothetical protein M408DRAFT_19156 [Serendipita vermifera MAFF 305830]
MSSPAENSDSNRDLNETEREIQLLQEKLGNEDPEKVVKRHIKLLHEYNESKDAAQALMGKLAVIHGVSVRHMHEKFGLSNED